jgi:predicted transcriptional regulator
MTSKRTVDVAVPEGNTQLGRLFSIMDYNAGRWFKARELARRLQSDRETVRQTMRALRLRGLVETQNQGRGDWSYRVPPEATT